MSAPLKQVRQRRKEVLEELALLEQMRRGSLTPQFFDAQRKDGSKVRRGPYLLYTFKEKGKTVSRRISDQDLALQYQDQIKAFRRFEALTAELVRLGEKISDLVLSDEDELKKNEADGKKMKS